MKNMQNLIDKQNLSITTFTKKPKPPVRNANQAYTGDIVKIETDPNEVTIQDGFVPTEEADYAEIKTTPKVDGAFRMVNWNIEWMDYLFDKKTCKPLAVWVCMLCLW